MPTEEELARLARSEPFDEVEKAFLVLDVVRGTQRNGYPSSGYYVPESPNEVNRRHQTVDKFLTAARGRRP